MNFSENLSFQPDLPTQQLPQIQTPFGLRDLYDSIAFCNRCGSCMQVCPTYRLSGLETDSPRGRNQAARLVLEGKLKLNEPAVQSSLESCLLCGRCTQACGAKIPTAQHVLEMRRALKKRSLPIVLEKFLALRATKPALFARLFRIGMILRPAWKLFSLFPKLAWLKLAARRIPQKTISLQQAFKQIDFAPNAKKPQFIYLPSFEAQFLQPEIALASWQLITKNARADCWLNTACGLFEYIYGDLRQSKRILRQLIRKHRAVKNGTLPLITDSLDVYHFLLLAPQLFAKQQHLTAQAQNFAKHVRYITDFFPKRIFPSADIKLPVQLDCGSIFSRESIPVEQSISLLKTLFKQNFVECGYIAFDTPAFGYGFTAGNQNERILLEVVKNVARKQTKTVFTFSGLGALELNQTLRRYYPAAEAKHIVCIVAKK